MLSPGFPVKILIRILIGGPHRGVRDGSLVFFSSPNSASLVPIGFLVFFICDGQPLVGTVSTPFDFSTGLGRKSNFDRRYCSSEQCCHNLRRCRSVVLRWWPQSQVSTDSIAVLRSDVINCVDVVRFFYVGGHKIYLPGGSGLV